MITKKSIEIAHKDCAAAEWELLQIDRSLQQLQLARQKKYSEVVQYRDRIRFLKDEEIEAIDYPIEVKPA